MAEADIFARPRARPRGWIAIYYCFHCADTIVTALRLSDALAYGVRLYAFLAVTTAVGGAMLALGGSIGWTAFQTWLDGGSLDTANAVSGGLLTFLGISILAIGFLGAGYKILADGVSAGGEQRP